MLYSDLYLKKQHNYTPFFAIALVLVVFSVFLYSSRNNITITSASKRKLVKHQVVNVSSGQVGIFWQTDEADEGWVIYGTDKNNLSSISSDEQDVGTNKNKRTLHYAVLKNLQQDTNYYYKIVSNRQLISDKNESFGVKTSINYTVSSNTKPAYGKVLLPSGDAAVGSFVFLTYKNTYPFLATTKSSGEWLIPLQYGVDKVSNEIVSIVDDEVATIEVVNQDLVSTVKASLKNVSPLPKTIVLGQSYDFLVTTDEDVLPASTKRNSDKQYAVELLYPKDGAVIPGSQPLIRGKGVPGAEVIVNVNTKPVFTARTIIEKDMSWKVTMPSSVRPGIYQLTVTTEDVQGMKIGFRRRFVMAKSGETVLADATGPATLTVTPTTAFSSPMPTQTMIPEPTITNTFYNPTATPVPPTSGVNGSMPYIFGGITMVVLGVGLVLLF